MSRTDQWKLAIVVLATGLAIWYLLPSYRYFTLTPAQRQALPASELAALRKSAVHLGLDLQGGMHLTLEVDKSRLNAEEAKDAVDRAMEVLRRRVDEFGVAEPLIQREGQDRITIQLPGLTDRKRAMDLIGKTALLEFRLVRTPEEGKNLWSRLDAYLAARGGAAALDSAMRTSPLTSHMMETENPSFVREEDVPTVQKLLTTAGIDSVIPPDSQILWGSAGQGSRGVTGRELYVMRREPEMTGGSIATAQAQVGLSSADPGARGASMTIARAAPTSRASPATSAATYHQASTASRLGTRDRERILNGNASITGSFNVESARDMRSCVRGARRRRSTPRERSASSLNLIPSAKRSGWSAPRWWWCSWRSTTSLRPDRDALVLTCSTWWPCVRRFPPPRSRRPASPGC
jgi:protein-export membrane protein SecD